MSAISLILLCTAATATALGGAALHTAQGLRRQLTALRAQLDAQRGETAQHADAQHTAPAAAASGAVPRAREGGFAEEIRTAVAEALADERERELAEARAFWAAQEARDCEPDNGSLLAGHGTEYEVAPGALADHLDALLDLDPEADAGEIFIPRQNGPEDGDGESAPPAPGAKQRDRSDPADGGEPEAEAETPRAESPDLAAARRRHPSHPDYNLNGDPVIPSPAPSTAPTVADHERTVERLAELAIARTPLADVRPGPLGTLDVYVFEDGTTVCLSPGHRATSEALGEALRLGESPVLLGGSGIAGSYALTFGFPNGDTAYLLADRVIASR
ncbi:hypothetical protein OIE63_24060 [Streptomyces sp. NBC_01795]|uniref:hypothetical protein n=1 Tax=Streptomyces sp. NBC_01795 TaxID=2975943 RepID=UPI002DDC8992|nr:hypothetical protein [Streptomyces sp. NBC_01795]WSA94306.1 hypothetical protein OIE63_24060 [Streptomyces sp. NBC_01795]